MTYHKSKVISHVAVWFQNRTVRLVIDPDNRKGETVLGIVLGVKCIHSKLYKDLIHRDLKAENIFADREYRFEIGLF
jgi:serine/threonine protein kinase